MYYLGLSVVSLSSLVLVSLDSLRSNKVSQYLKNDPTTYQITLGLSLLIDLGCVFFSSKILEINKCIAASVTPGSKKRIKKFN